MVAQRTQTMYTNHWCVCRTTVARGGTAMRTRLLQSMIFAVLAFGIVSCAEFTNMPADITRLQSDLNTQNETLAKISARIDALEHRPSTPDNVSGPTQQELMQAIAVLLKKALEIENRLNTIESGGLLSRVPERPVKQGRQPETKGTSGPRGSDQHGSPPMTQSALSSQSASAPGATRISLGMTPEEVRGALGDPISTETSDSYIFWHYSRVTNQKYVIFEKGTRQVSGWWGL
jgi:hypothetical protein